MSRLILVLGEMRELGAQSEREHRILGSELGDTSLLIAVGERAEPLFKAHVRRVFRRIFANASEAGQRAAMLVEPGDVVLVKGSRALRLERVVQALVALKGYAA